MVKQGKHTAESSSMRIQRAGRGTRGYSNSGLLTSVSQLIQPAPLPINPSKRLRGFTGGGDEPSGTLIKTCWMSVGEKDCLADL